MAKLNLKILKLNFKTENIKNRQFHSSHQNEFIPSTILVQPAENPFKPKFSYISVMKKQLKNVKTQFEHAKIPSKNPKTQFYTAKTQIGNAKIQKNAQVLAQVFPWAVYLLNTLYKLLPGCFQRNLGCFLE